jgi:peptidoglycan/xylan/chitin deacetylase (PgdA/CDA1 family)
MKKIIFITALLFSINIYAEKGFYAEGNYKKNSFSLTYDDGPGKITTELLKLLNNYNAKATFFVLGENVKKYPEILKMVKENGHLIGNHTYSHKNFYSLDKSNLNKEEILIKEIEKSEYEIKKVTGEKPIFMRLPNGFSKTWAKTIINEKGYTLINWTFGCDWERMEEKKMTEKYLKALKPGAILLMHDGGKNKEKTLRITEAILKKARELGLKPVTIDELIK